MTRTFFLRVSLFTLAFFAVEALFAPAAQAQRKPWQRYGRKRRVKIYSQPPGASVYIDDKKWGIFCYTPCTARRYRLPRRKTYKIIFVKDGYKTKTETLEIPRRYRRYFTVSVALSVEIKPGLLDVQSDPSGNATGGMVFVDGKQLGTVPTKLKIMPGRHNIKVVKSGYTTFNQWVEIKQNATWTVQAIIKPLSKPKGTLIVSVDVAKSIVHLDGKPLGAPPQVVPNLVVGPHTVKITAKGAKPWSKVIVIKSGQIERLNVKIAHLVQKPTGILVVAVDIPGAQVWVDGKGPYTAPAIVRDLSAGPHTVKVQATGVQAWTKVVEVKGGKTERVDVKLQGQLVKSGTARVVCNVAGATVFIDGEKKGVCPVTVTNLVPGDHLAVVKQEGYLDKKVPFKVAVNQQSLINIDLEKKPEEKDEGTLRVQCEEPDAEVILDGQRVGAAPVGRKGVPAGEHVVKVVKEGYKPYVERFNLVKGTTKTITAILKAVGTLKVTSSPPGARVLIDMKVIGQTPIAAHELPTGNYTLEIKLGGHHGQRKALAVSGGQSLREHFDLLKIRKGPTKAQEKKGLSSYSANTVAPGRFTADFALAYPMFFMTRLTVGAFRKGMFGIDAGVFINVQGIINEFGAHARFQLVKAGPFSLAVFTEVGGGPGFESRNTVLFNVGAALSLRFKYIITVSARIWANVYSDKFCIKGGAGAGESEPDFCQEAADGTFDNFTDAPLENKIRSGELDLRTDRITKARVYIALDIEIALGKSLSLFGEISGAPGAGPRAMYHNAFNPAMLKTSAGGDPLVYGKIGITAKF